MYQHLTEGLINLYLPSLSSPACSSDYLEKVFFSLIFTIKKKEIRLAPSVARSDITCSDLVAELQMEKTNLNLKELGFSQERPPNKDYLINLLFTLHETHPYFSQFEEDNKVLSPE